MKIGLIGNGGREHAIARSISKNKDAQLFVAASHENDGIKRCSKDYKIIDLKNPKRILEYFASKNVDFVVVGPEAPLMVGAIDKLRKANIPSVGPTKRQARLEGNKVFMRNLLKDELGWGSPKWQAISSIEDAKSFIKSVGDVVVKPIGLTGGKGVKVMGIQLKTHKDTLDYINSLIREEGIVLLEEKIVGEEFSRMAFISDGVILPAPIMQDYKYAFDGDKGLMTGGMGAYSFRDGKLPFLLQEDVVSADLLMSEVLEAIEKRTDSSYRGFLYGQFMKSKRGIVLIEFNVRLGDPEALNLMSLLNTDCTDLFSSIANGNLNQAKVSFRNKSSVSKYLVPNSYPKPIIEKIPFRFDEKAVINAGFILIHGAVERKDENLWQALGSRTLGLVGIGETPGEISGKMEAFLEKFEPEELRHRKDIGNSAVIQKKIEAMETIGHD